MILRGQIYWIDLGEPEGSKPAKERPVAVVQADQVNQSAISTVLAVIISSNTTLAAMPGNVFLPKTATGLPQDSVANVTALVTVNKDDCRAIAGTIPAHLMRTVDDGLRIIMNL